MSCPVCFTGDDPVVRESLNAGNGGFYNLGLDFRHYQKLYKNIIWANRLAGAHSG